MQERNIFLDNVDVGEVITKKTAHFYNPLMQLNRDISLCIINHFKPKRIGLPLSGTGVRALRIASEVSLDEECKIFVNDRKFEFNKLFSNLANSNNIDLSRFEISNKDANIFMQENNPLDFIEIDPYGSPNNFLDSSFQSLKQKSFLSVTATDTAPLCGTYPKACLRKYWAKPGRVKEMHEIGLRILIRKVQLIGAQYNFAVYPIVSYYKNHYFKVIFKCNVSKSLTNEVLTKHGMYDDFGPLWLGDLQDEEILSEMIKEDLFPETTQFFEQLLEENKMEIGFVHVHSYAKELKAPQIPKFEDIIAKASQSKINVCKTHFSRESLKSENKEELKKIIQQLF